MLSRFFAGRRKRAAIRGYLRVLPRLLAKEYGASRYYAPAQVRSTIERAGLDTTYSCYAITLFSSETDFQAYHQAIGEDCDFAAMRAEIGHAHFHGNADFTANDVASHAAGWDGHAAGHGAGHGSFDGGGGGHGH